MAKLKFTAKEEGILVALLEGALPSDTRVSDLEGLEPFEVIEFGKRIDNPSTFCALLTPYGESEAKKILARRAAKLAKVAPVDTIDADVASEPVARTAGRR